MGKLTVVPKELHSVCFLLLIVGVVKYMRAGHVKKLTT